MTDRVPFISFLMAESSFGEFSLGCTNVQINSVDCIAQYWGVTSVYIFVDFFHTLGFVGFERI